MSLIVAMQVAGDDVVLAADRRGTYGDPRGLVCLDENMTKLHVCGNTVLGIVGMPGAILEPVRAFQAAVAVAPDPIATLSTALRQHYEKNFGLRPFGAKQLDRDAIDKIVSGNDARIARFASSFQETTDANP